MHAIRSLKSGEWFWIDKTILWKHTSVIGFSALAVYAFLASMADENQSCYPSQKYIADHLRCSRATVNRAIQKLAKHKLIEIEKKSRRHFRYLLVPIDSCKRGTQVSHTRNSVVSKVDTNKTKQQEINNNTVVCVTKEDLLAQDIANALNAQEHIKSYQLFAHTYPEDFLRTILSEVKLTPLHKIKKSRHALFIYLIRYYAKSLT